MILSFVISIYTARYLGPKNYGLLNYASAFVAFATSFCTLGINYVIIKDFVDFPNEQGEGIGTTICLRLASSVLSAILIVLVSFCLDFGETETITVVALSAMALIFQSFDTINSWFQSLYRSKITSIATLCAYIITSLYKIVLIILHKNVRWFAFANSLDYICLAVFLICAYRSQGGPRFSFSFKKGKRLLKSSYHYILSGMMVAIYAQTDKVMLKHMLDDASVGYYSLASSINLMWVFVLQAIIDSIYPTIIEYSKNNQSAFEKKNRQLYAIVIYLSLLVGICFTVFGHFIITLLYGNAYSGAVAPLKVVTWYTVFSYLGVARNAWIVCKKQQKYLKYMYLGAAIINVLLNFILIPLLGATGAALASLITQICTCMALPMFIKSMRPNVKLMIDAFLLRGIQ